MMLGLQAPYHPRYNRQVNNDISTLVIPKKVFKFNEYLFHFDRLRLLWLDTPFNAVSAAKAKAK